VAAQKERTAVASQPAAAPIKPNERAEQCYQALGVLLPLARSVALMASIVLSVSLLAAVMAVWGE
jgi:hypothetical protein